MNKRITVETKTGKTQTFVVRQMPHDREYKIGGKLFGGKIVKIEEGEN